VVDGRAEQGLAHSSASGLLIHEEAHDRPHGSIVHRLHDRGPGQLLVVLAGTEGDPADRSVVLVRDQTGDAARIDEGFHPTAIRRRPGPLPNHIPQISEVIKTRAAAH
jgi:hypothetical protein